MQKYLKKLERTLYMKIIIPDDIPGDFMETSEIKDEEEIIDEKEKVQKEETEFRIKRRLIERVRRRRVLYDSNYKLFSSVEAKEEAWRQIGKELHKDVDACKSMWIDLRYMYQRHVRRLRKFFRRGTKHKKRRPVMAYERELLFLWRYIPDRIRLPKKAVPAKTPALNDSYEDDDVVMLIEEPPIIVIDADENETTTNSMEYRTTPLTLQITPEIIKFIEAVEPYPELYDVENRYYNDYRRKGIIWNALANELKEKATKLMKLWIYLCTRYEWQANQITTIDTELEKVLSFLRPYVLKNHNTVYKQSSYVKYRWQEPIEHFKNIFQLLVAIRKFPKIVSYTDEDLLAPRKEEEYHLTWMQIAKMRGVMAGQCEVTWLIMRQFYWDLMRMRKHTYQLQDKWYFESIISELYANTAPPKNKQPVVPKPSDQDVYANSYATFSPVTVTVDDDSDDDENKNETPHVYKSGYPPAIINVSNNTFQILPKITSAKSLNVSNHPSFAGQNKQTVYTAPGVPSLPPVFPYGISLVPASTSANVPIPQNSTTVSKSSWNAQSNNVLPIQGNNIVPSTSAGLSTSNNIAVPRKNIVIASNNIVASNDAVATKPLLRQILHHPSQQRATSAQLELPLTKINSASSVLNPNEIIIELIATPQGNQLVVHGPPLTKKYLMSMKTTANFIREIMAIPKLHNKNCQSSSIYWQYLARKFRLPGHICKACWNFLSENFNHFNQIAPMNELMRPFKTNLKVWVQSTALFSKFEILVANEGWLKYRTELPDLMESISQVKDLDSILIEKKPFPPQIRSRFSHIPDLHTICTAFQNVFLAYMNDLENGIENSWPRKWWRTLSKLKFLLDVHYKTTEPFYYIIRNKIYEEIANCLERESQPIPQEVAETCDQKREPSEPCSQVTLERTRSLSVVETYKLMLLIRRKPAAFLGPNYGERTEAWKEVAKKMNASADDCRVAFVRAVKQYHYYIHRDPASRCRLNHKYYLPITEIQRFIKSRKVLNIKTPTELNMSVAGGEQEVNELVFPERFILDISMENSKPCLVVKNWIYALGNLSAASQKNIESKVINLLNKYRNQYA